MPDRKPLPPIRLNGALPDGVHNGLDQSLGAYFVDAGEPRLAVVRLGRKQLIHDDDTDAEVAVVRLLDIEVPGAGSAQAQMLDAVLRATRKDRTSVGTLPFGDDPPSGDAARRAAYEQAVIDYSTARDMDPREAWEAHFGPDAPVGPRGADLRDLLEYAGDAGITIDGELPAGEPEAEEYCDESVHRARTDGGLQILACALAPGHDGDHRPLCVDQSWCEQIDGHDGDHDPEPDDGDPAAEDDARHAAAMAPTAPEPEWSDAP